MLLDELSVCSAFRPLHSCHNCCCCFLDLLRTCCCCLIWNRKSGRPEGFGCRNNCRNRHLVTKNNLRTTFFSQRFTQVYFRKNTKKINSFEVNYITLNWNAFLGRQTQTFLVDILTNILLQQIIPSGINSNRNFLATLTTRYYLSNEKVFLIKNAKDEKDQQENFQQISSTHLYPNKNLSDTKNEENKSPTDFLRKKCKDERDLLTSVYQSRKKHLLKRNYKTVICSVIKIDLINVLTRRRKYLYFHSFHLQAKPKIIIELLLL